MCFFEHRLCSRFWSIFCLIERKVTILAKTIQQCPTYLIFGILGLLEHNCMPRNKWKKVQRFVAVILNLALRGLWTASILYSDKLYSGVFFRRGVHSLYDCGRDLAHPQKCRNHWAKYSCPKAPVLSHSIIDSEFRRPGRWKFWVVTPVVPTLPSPQPRRLCNMYLNFQGGFLLIHKGSIPQCWTALTFRNIFLVLS